MLQDACVAQQSPPGITEYFDFTNVDVSHAATINLLTDNPADTISTVLTDQTMVWAKVAVAVDSGAVVHVSPAHVFSLAFDGKTAETSKYFAADGSPIDNLGSSLFVPRMSTGSA